jgi:probable O-glycosylation ligase (exosortase A-associated)
VIQTAPAWWRPADTRPRAVAIRTAPASENPLAFWALVAFTVILLLSPQIWFPVLGSLRIAFIAAGIAIGAHLLHRLGSSERTAPFFPEIGIAILLVSWSVITLPLSYWPGGSVETLVDHFLKAVAVFWLLGTLVTSTKRLVILSWALVLCSIPLAVTGLNNYLSGMFLKTGVQGLQRIYGYHGGSGIAGNPNDLALMLNLIIPIAGALILVARSAAMKGLAAAAMLLSMVAVIVTFSRAGFLTLAATFLMCLWVLIRSRAPGKAAALLISGLLLLPLVPTGYADRLSTITDTAADRTGSAQGRLKDFKTAVGIVARNPVVGAGIGQDILAMNEERGADWTRVHNAFLEYAVDLGVPGLLLFLWLFVACFRTARAVERQAARDPALRDLASMAMGVQISLVAFGVAACFHPIAYQFYFFCIGGLAVALKRAYMTDGGTAAAVEARAS